MTDKETIKALEYCTNESDGECKECEYDKYYPRCVPKLLEDALDIINLQKAEIERLQKEVNLVSIQFQDLQERYEEAQTEIEQWKEEANRYQKLWCTAVDDKE